MAGHSKWANIKHQKAKADAKKGKLFTKLIRAIMVAAKKGSDPNANPQLRDAVKEALNANMTRDVVDRAIKRGSGEMDGANMMEEIMYEGYGPGGVAIMVECLTDNRNRTVAEVRHAFTKHGGNLGTDGSVAYLFKKSGLLVYSSSCDENKMMEVALEAGAEDIKVNEDGSFDVLTAPEHFVTVKEFMVQSGLNPEQAEITFLPDNYVKLEKEQAETMMKLQDKLEDLDDVQNVYSNAEIADDIFDELMG